MEEFLKEEITNFEVYEGCEHEERAEKMNKRQRQWCGTWNNPKMTDEEFNSYLANLETLGILQYAVFQREKGEETGTEHFQFYVEFKNSQYFKKLKEQYLPKGCHFAPMISSPERCRAYCTKVDTRVSGPYEIGEFVSQGKRTDLAKAIQLADEGVAFDIIEKMYPTQSLMYGRQLLERISRFAERINSEIAKSWRDLTITYIYGDSGTGKTRYVMEKHGYENVYRVTSYDRGAFDGYKGQKVICFEEFRSGFTITDMLNFLDGYPVDLPARYGNKPALYTEVYIISNESLAGQYKNLQQDNPKSYQAFLRRIHNVYRFDKLGMHIEKTKEKVEQMELSEIPLEASKDMPFED